MKQFKRLCYPYFIWAFILIVIPMFLICMYAFTTKGNNVATLKFTLDNFLSFFREPIYIDVMIRSLKIAFMTTVLCIVLGYPVAYLVANMEGNKNKIMILLITLPMWINMLVRTYAWVGILSDKGLINTVLGWFGIDPIHMMYTDFAVALGMVYNFIPFMILQIHSSLAKMDKSLIQAAYDLGADKKQTFLKVIFPLSLPGVVSGITLVFLPAVSSFVIPKLLGGGQYVLVGNLIETQFITVGEWNFGSAISLIMAVIIMISMWVTKKVDKDNQEAKGGNE